MPVPPRILVVGSINMDLVARLPALPRPGETVTADDFRYVPGGKGANQAVAAARLGARVTMIGRVGDDPFGTVLRAGLEADRIVTDHVAVTDGCSSGLAWIGVDDQGRNAITLVAGANGRLTPPDLSACDAAFAQADAVLLQLEIPLEAAAEAVRLAKRHGVPAILDAAPVPARGALPSALYAVDVFTPNQTEAEALTGKEVDSVAAAQEAARCLQSQGAHRVVIKLGELGAAWLDETGQCGHIGARPIAAVDTTACGDAFTAALAVSLAEGAALPEAVAWGCAAGTLAALTPGAQPAMPTRQMVARFLSQEC